MLSKTLSGRSIIDGPLVERPFASFPPAASYPGATALSDQGLAYVSMRWPLQTDPYRWVSLRELAEDVVNNADLPQITNVELSVTVHPTNPLANFTTLGDAVAFMTRYIPAAVTQGGSTTAIQHLNGYITILSGAVLAEQVVIQNASLGWVRIRSEDDTVQVMESALTRNNFNYSTIEAYHFLSVRNGVCPEIETIFVAVPDGLNRATTGLQLQNASHRGRNDDAPDGWKKAGFQGFDTGVNLAAGCSCTFLGAEHINNRTYNVLTGQGSFYSQQGGKLTGAGVNSVFCRIGGWALLQTVDVRKIEGVDTSDGFFSDLTVQNGGYIILRSNSPALINGGASQPFNVPTAHGTIFRSQGGGTSVWPGIIKPQPYVVNTVPLASLYPDHMIFVRNGDAGQPCLAVSDGTTWRRIPLGPTISATA